MNIKLFIVCSSLITALLGGVGAWLSLPQSGIIFEDNFESGTFSSWGTNHFCCDYSVQVTDEIAREGEKSLRFLLKSSDPLIATGKRTELYRPGRTIQKIGKEYWYALSIFVDDNFTVDSSGYSILTQWYSEPQRSEGEVSRSPPLALMIKGDRWAVDLRADTTRIQKMNRAMFKQQIWWEKVEPNAWSDFVFHIKWSYEDDGILEAWKDGVKIIDRRGMNVYNDDEIYLKIGIYKSLWNKTPNRSIVSERIFYHDAIKIGDHTLTYNDVALVKKKKRNNKSTILYPVADAEISSANPNQNLGKEPRVEIKNAPNNIREAYLKFDLSEIEGKIDSAFFYVRPFKMRNSIIHYNIAYVEDDQWSEDSLTWNNQPEWNRLIGSIEVNTLNCYHNYDISNLAKTEHANDKLLSLKLTAPNPLIELRSIETSYHHTKEKEIYKLNFGIKVYSSGSSSTK